MISVASSVSSLSSNTNLAAIDNGMPSDSTAMLAARDIRRCFDNFVEPSRYPKFSISPTGKCLTFQSLFPPFPIFNSTEAQHFDQINLSDFFFGFFFFQILQIQFFVIFTHLFTLYCVVICEQHIFFCFDSSLANAPAVSQVHTSIDLTSSGYGNRNW